MDLRGLQQWPDDATLNMESALSLYLIGDATNPVPPLSPCNESAKISPIHAVDLFCGIGGLTHGLRLSGINVKAGIDIDNSCRYAYETNNLGAEFLTKDIREVSRSHITQYFTGANVTALVGCAPCQPYSSHNRKIPRNQSEEDCSLLHEFARLVRQVRPDIVSMENVPGLLKHVVFEGFLGMLQDLKYEVKHDVLSCVNYGIPQTRKRLVLLASRLGTISLPRPVQERQTVADVLRNLPELEAGQADLTDPVHVSVPLSEKNRARILQSRPGGTWKDWNIEDVSECHKKSYYPASYGRMRWEAPAPTITTQFCYYSTGRFGHPEQNRALSVREGALLQTFPREYKFFEHSASLTPSQMARHIGNAVPVALAQAIGTSILEVHNG